MPFSGVPEKTGKPMMPSNKYNATVATPSFHPKPIPIIKITKVFFYYALNKKNNCND